MHRGRQIVRTLPADVDDPGVPETDEVHVHLEDLSYIDHACLELIGDWERQREPRGGTLILEWEKLEARNLSPQLAS